MNTHANIVETFGQAAGAYRQGRPGYPTEMFMWLASHAPARECAWDCATGSGQAAVQLANFFRRVIATDASEEQLSQAPAYPGIEYRLAYAEDCGLPNRSVDCISVATAAHWFRLPEFYAEARRVLKPGGLIAIYSYASPFIRVNPEVDAITAYLKDEIVGDMWDPRTRHVFEGYKNLYFPFEPMRAPSFTYTNHVSVEDWLAFMRSWSAVHRYGLVNNADAVALIEPDLRRAWGPPGRHRDVFWQINLKVARVDGR